MKKLAYLYTRIKGKEMRLFNDLGRCLNPEFDPYAYLGMENASDKIKELIESSPEPYRQEWRIGISLHRLHKNYEDMMNRDPSSENQADLENAESLLLAFRSARMRIKYGEDWKEVLREMNKRTGRLTYDPYADRQSMEF